MNNENVNLILDFFEFMKENGRIEYEQVVKEFIDSTQILEIEDYKKELGEDLVQSIINDWDS